MVDATSAISSTNTAIVNAVTGKSSVILSVVGWIIFFIILGGIAYWYLGRYLPDKKLFSKKIVAFVSNGLYWKPKIRDVAKTVKIGSGGFEIFYLKKSKVFRIGYGGEVGDDYYFYIMPDGYWYNALQQAGVNAIDKAGGLIPIVTTNPLMRGQYTALEKQIDSLTQVKKSWFEQYGVWVMGISFVLVAGIMLFLCFREFSNAMSTLSAYQDNMNQLLGKINTLLGNVQNLNAGSNGLKPVN